MRDREFEAFAIIFGCGLLGVLAAVIEYLLYTYGIILDDYLVGNITLLDVQTFTVIFFMFGGVILAAINN